MTFSVGAIGPVRKFSARYRVRVGEQLMDLAKEVAGSIQLFSLPET